jgi:hypothetical protein
VGVPAAVRGVVPEPQPTRAPAVAPEQIGGDAGFVEEYVLAGIAQPQAVLPVATSGGDISAALFVGVDGFF